MEVPIHVVLTVGTKTYTLTAVGDPTDKLFAYDVGRAVRLAVLGIVEDDE